MHQHPETIEHVGYLTAVRTADGGAQELYLHTGGRSLRVLFGPVGPDGRAASAQVNAAADLPLGPQHRVRITGCIAGQAELPILWASSADLLGRGQS